MLQKSVLVRTALCVQDVVLVQWPPTQTGGIEFIALQNDCPFLPQDETGTGFILVTDRHYVLKRWDTKNDFISLKKTKQKQNYKEALWNFTRESPSNFIPVIKCVIHRKAS